VIVNSNRYWQFCKTLIGNNSHSIKHRAMEFACSMGFSATADRMVWPPCLSRDRKWPRISECTHSRVVGLRIKNNLVFISITSLVLVWILVLLAVNDWKCWLLCLWFNSYLSLMTDELQYVLSELERRWVRGVYAGLSVNGVVCCLPRSRDTRTLRSRDHSLTARFTFRRDHGKWFWKEKKWCNWLSRRLVCRWAQ